MGTSGSTFSETWHLVSGLHLELRTTVDAHRQFFRGEKWFVLRDPFNNRFFRVSPPAYDFLMRLRRDRTVEEAWLDSMERFPETAPGQEEVIRLLGQLYAMNLLASEVPPDSKRLFDRYSRTRQREIRSRLASILFIRVPLFDPEALLRRFSWGIRAVFSPLGVAAWFATVLWASKQVLDHGDLAVTQTQSVLAPDNLFLLYLGLVLVKTVHEFGHAAACRRFGGEVHTMGIMFLVFTPLPYMDATSSWGFRNRWHRALTGAAGMLAEVFVAALAALYWARTGEGTLHSLAYNIMFVASVSTVLFNANPLLRFDGYYILSDVLDIPNLHTRASQHLKHLVQGPLFGCKDSATPAKDRREAAELTVFGILSACYRILIFSSIILFVSDRWLIVGMLMAAFGIVSWLLRPLVRAAGYLLFDSRVQRCRKRALGVTAAFLIAASAGLGFLPVPQQVYAPGVVEGVPFLQVVNRVSGHVREPLARPGERVTEGTPLLELENRELRIEIRSAEAKVDEVRALEQQALGEKIADLKPIRKRLRAAKAHLNELRQNEHDLVVRARASGVWSAPPMESLVGRWVERGHHLGAIVGDRRFRFSAVVPQDEAAEVFDDRVGRVEVRLRGEAGRNVGVDEIELIPYQHETLPSAALGWMGGGEVAVDPKRSGEGDAAAEPFFLVHAKLRGNPDVRLAHGRSGRIRFSLDPKPLLVQWGRRLYQMLQTRYRL